MDWMYEVSYHPHSDQGSPKTSPHTSPIPIPTLKFVARPGHEAPWDSPIFNEGSPTHKIKTTANHINAPRTAHPGFESPWDSPIYDEDEESYSESSYTDAMPIPLRMTTATIISARKPSETVASRPSHAEEAPWDFLIPSKLSETVASRPHHAEEAPWDSPIETPDHPILDHHAPNSHYEHLHNHAHNHNHDHDHVSGVSSPTSSAADPGFEVPWDSPILADSDSAPMTPFSEIDGSDYLSEDSTLHYASKPLTHPAYRNDTAIPTAPIITGNEEVAVKGDEEVVRQSKPMREMEHPALGMTDGHFGQDKRAERGMGCALNDGASKEEFLWHMYGVCGCGRKAIMTPLRRE